MTKNKCKIAAKKFYKSTKGSINFISAEKFVTDLGFKIVFYNTPEGDIEAARYGVLDDIDLNEAFAYKGTAKIIFIDNDAPCERKLYLLLHEIGHIMLNHFGNGTLLIKDKVLLDIEASAFAYEVLTYRPLFHLSYIPVAIGITCILLTLIFLLPFRGGTSLPASTSFTVPPSTSYNPANSLSPESDIVYVTHAGGKYHRADCIHIRNKSVFMLTKSEAQKNYAPCSVCNP